jgi:flagellar hook-length control protein FliK
MNATPPIFQVPRISEAAQTSMPASPAQAPQAGSRDFATTLRDAGHKPVRRHASHKHPESSPDGNQLPAPGNLPPPALVPPPPAGTESPAATQGKDAAGAPAIAPAGNAAEDPGPKPAAIVSGESGAPKAVDDPVLAGDVASLMDADPKIAAAAPTAAAAAAAVAAAPALPEASAAASPAAPAAISSGGAPPAGPSTPHAASIRSLPTTDPQVRAAPRDAAKSDAALAAATSRPTSADGNSVLNGQAPSNASAAAAADADAAAQAVMAAAVTQASAPANNASVSADDTITPEGGISLQGMAAANDAPLAAPTAPGAKAAPSAIAAASAAAVVQAAQGAADAGAADRHARGNSADSSLSAATNDGAAGAAQLLTSNAPADAAAPMPTFKIAAGVDTGDFGQGVADRVSLMMDGNLSTAKLQVNPPALGPIEVRIALQAGHAQVWLSSHSAVTRDALESSAPKLREMLGAQGFAQVSVDISQRSFQERSPPSHAYEASPAFGDSPAVLQASTAVSRAASGLLDAYA